MTATLDDVQILANQLSPRDQVRLIEHLSRQIAPILPATATLPIVGRPDTFDAKA